MSKPRSEIKNYIISRLTELRCARAGIACPTESEWRSGSVTDVALLDDVRAILDYDARIQELSHLFDEYFESVEMAC